MHSLEISGLDERHFGITKAIALAYQEATSVCLDRHHTSPIVVAIRDNSSDTDAGLKWLSPDSKTKAGWNNQDDATTEGAYCVALATMELTRGLVAVGRAETRTGADYYLGLPGQTLDDYEDCLRLEVSGINHGTEAAILYRINQKIAQAQKGKSNLPAIATVVEFSNPSVIAKDVPAK